MNQITIHGNLTADPTVRTVHDGQLTLATFRVAMNRRHYNPDEGRWTDRKPVFQSVVAFGQLADNAAGTLTKGMAVVVTGELVDDTFAPNGRVDVQCNRLHAADIAVSLRRAVATVTKTTTQPAESQSADDAEDTR